MVNKILQKRLAIFKENEDKKEFRLEGYGIYDLLKSEDGIHLFYIPHQNPIPIRVTFTNENEKVEFNKKQNVIRLYNGNATVILLTSFTLFSLFSLFSSKI